MMTVVDTVQMDPVVNGPSAQVGWGPALFRYTIYVEAGIRIKRQKFGAKVDSILADERGWIRGGKVSFQRVDIGAGTQIILARPESVDKLCWPLKTEGVVSCNQGTKVVINLERWREGVPHWRGPIRTYRQMLINHEMGHRIGQSHRYCPGAGKLAPVMQQQTYGFQGCVENSWPLDSEL